MSRSLCSSRFRNFQGTAALHRRDPGPGGMCRCAPRSRSPRGKHVEQSGILLPLMALLALIAPGCLQSEATLRVNRDGSGTMEMNLLVNEEMAAMMSAGAAVEEGEEPRIMSDVELIARGAQLGEDVRFVSSEKIVKPGYEGVRALYEFDDIRKIRMQMSPGDPGQAAAGEPITFDFAPARDGVSRLSIHIPSDSTQQAQSTESSAPKPTAEEIEQMRSIFGGLRISAKLVTEGEIVETNSPYREGSTVTLLEMDFDQLLSDIDKFTEVVSMGQPKDLGELTERLRGVPGIKINPTDTVTIDFSTK